MRYFPSKKTWLQILFWGIFWVTLPVLLSGNPDHYDWLAVRSTAMFLAVTVIVVCNIEWLLPRFYFRQKSIEYVVAGILLLVVVSVLLLWGTDLAWDILNKAPAPAPDHPGRPPGRHGMRVLGMLTPLVTVFIGTALFEIASFARAKEKEAAESRNEKLEAELKFLKSQINPHFLFNALNNIYSLTVIKSDQAPDNLLKLSGMLRYMLYDCKADRVPLEKEIDYLRHFIDLHLLKDSRGLNVKVNLDCSRPELPISPMILIPFVENAFKHSKVEDRENGWISIDLKTQLESLDFEVRNSLPDIDFTKDQAGGIGLHNVRRQLELIYPDRHTLDIEKGKDYFSVHLHIDLL